MIQKNEELEVNIVDMGCSGEGIAKISGYTTFIKGALKGEKVKIKMIKTNKDYGYGRLLQITQESKEREEAVCNVFGKCGGCNLQHMNYEAQLNHKTNHVKNTLRKALGKEIEVADTIGMGIPYYYRNKVQYPVVDGKIGFYADRSHRIVENKICYIQNQEADKLAKRALEVAQKYGVTSYQEESGKGFLRHIVCRIAKNTGEMMLIFVTNGEKFEKKEKIVKELLEEFSNLTSVIQNINTTKGNVILGETCILLYGEDYIVDQLGDYKFKISPLSFYQVNSVQTEILYQIAKDFAELKGEEIVFDLYSGIGTISIFLSDKAKKVYGVEVIEPAVEDARENAAFNEIRNVEFLCGEAEVIVPQMYEQGVRADVVFMDPPRKGCDERLLRTVVEMKAKKVVYVSCNPATLGRDLKYLVENGYEIKKIQPVDMFPQTEHVETISVLELK